MADIAGGLAFLALGLATYVKRERIVEIATWQFGEWYGRLVRVALPLLLAVLGFGILLRGLFVLVAGP